MFEAKLLMDMLMMVNTREGQHDEYYWRERNASRVHKLQNYEEIGARSVIEVNL
jgi:hypothetical protein